MRAHVCLSNSHTSHTHSQHSHTPRIHSQRIVDILGSESHSITHLHGMCDRITFGTTIFNVISNQNMMAHVCVSNSHTPQTHFQLLPPPPSHSVFLCVCESVPVMIGVRDILSHMHVQMDQH